MTTKEKELLLQDLCGRLPYGVKIQTIEIWTNKSNKIETLNDIFIPEDNIPRCGEGGVPIEYVKPYLFPFSSMTEEQIKELESLMEVTTIHSFGVVLSPTSKYYDWLNKNNFDYRGLIPIGLAIDATGLNIY